LETNITIPPQISITLHRLRILIAAILLILTVQAWSGDVVNIFFAPTNGTTPPAFTLSGYAGAIESVGPLLIWHAAEGIVIFALAVALVGLSFRWSKKRSVRICSTLALFFVFSAGLGGLLFVFSGFGAGGNSAQMGGSFLGAYAFYFMELYFTK
jgi:hypothetical protein